MTHEEFKQVQVGDFLVEGADHLIEVDTIGPDGVSYWEDCDWKVAKCDILRYPRRQPQWFSVNDRLPAVDTECIVLNNRGVISFGHIVDDDIAEDFDGWNIPDVAWWMPFEPTKDMLEYYEQ